MDSSLLPTSPWVSQSGAPEVFVEQAQHTQARSQCTDQGSSSQGADPYALTRRALSHLDLSKARGLKVLVKPNGGRVASSGSGIVTDARVVAAVIDAFLDAGAKVSVGDSPIAGVRHHEALEAMGVVEVARQRDCELVELDAPRPIEVDVPEGQALRTLRICRQVLEHELIVSVPVMKTHMHTGVTLAVKNMKGCLWRRTKVDLHMLPKVAGRSEKPLDIAIADLASVLRPHLSVVDGIVGLEGLGPSAGQKKALGAVVVGSDAFAVDAVCCRLMGIDVAEIPHLRLGAERRLGRIDLENFRVIPNAYADFATLFARPPENLSIQFPGVKILDEQSCSACQSTLLLFLKQYGARLRDYFPDDQALHVVIGKGHADVPRRALCIGNCTIKHREQSLYVTGCPPVGSAILAAISGHAERDDE